jgi:antitoxin PrlF
MRVVPRRVPRRSWSAPVLQLFCISAILSTMKSTLMLTRRGVVTLPAKMRAALGLKPDDVLIAETTPEGILLRPAVTIPIETYSPKRIREFDEAESELAKVLSKKKARRTR